MFNSLYFYYWYIRTIPFRKRFFYPKVMEIEETLDGIVEDKKSISRFGDGEFRLILPNEHLKFQEGHQLLSERLKEVLTSHLDNHIVAIPESFSTVQPFKLNVKYWWVGFINRFGNQLSSYLRKDKVYGNAFISRFYLDYQKKSKVAGIVRKIKKIWDDRAVLIVEGEFSRLGIGNDLFNNAASIERILCPSKNAFSKYEEILEKSKAFGKDKLILIALGPTATVLSYDLAKAGFWAVDIGHVDIEYMWFLAEAEHKIPVKYRLVNESIGQETIELPKDLEENYLNSIIYKISE